MLLVVYMLIHPGNLLEVFNSKLLLQSNLAGFAVEKDMYVLLRVLLKHKKEHEILKSG